MPLVRIDLVQGKSAEYRRAIGGVVYEAMVDVLKAPKYDRFQVIAEYPADALVADENYLVIRRTQDCVFIQLTFNIGRSVGQKKAFYKAVADTLHVRLGLRPEDVFINLIEVQKENWSFGNEWIEEPIVYDNLTASRGFLPIEDANSNWREFLRIPRFVSGASGEACDLLMPDFMRSAASLGGSRRRRPPKRRGRS